MLGAWLASHLNQLFEFQTSESLSQKVACVCEHPPPPKQLNSKDLNDAGFGEMTELLMARYSHIWHSWEFWSHFLSLSLHFRKNIDRSFPLTNDGRIRVSLLSVTKMKWLRLYTLWRKKDWFSSQFAVLGLGSFGDISKKMTSEWDGYLLWDGKLYRLGRSYID